LPAAVKSNIIAIDTYFRGEPVKANRGRPRAFDTAKALDAALELFWRHGYEGTSLAALTEAMHINVPSLYAAFGNKEALFRRAVQRYDEKYGGYFRDALAEPTARAVADKLFRGAINQVTRPGHPDGCLLVQGALACNEAAEPAQQVLRQIRAIAETAIRERFERAAAAGDLPPDVDSATLARFVWTLSAGMAVQAASGASRAQLQEVADVAMRSWPEKRRVAPGSRQNSGPTR
jgi:AcrR family transcriptional regulator